MKHRWLVLALTLSLPALACEAGPEPGAESAPGEEPATGEMAEPMASQAMMSLPDTTAQAVWSYLQEQSYRDSWELWPNKGELYQGGEPHGMLLTTYLNDEALDALANDSGPLPHGSIVVKENFMPDSTLAAITVMYAAEGNDAEHNDWFWAKYQPDGSVDAAGRVQSCISCHEAGQRGYLRTPDG